MTYKQVTYEHGQKIGPIDFAFFLTGAMTHNTWKRRSRTYGHALVSYVAHGITLVTAQL